MHPSCSHARSAFVSIVTEGREEDTSMRLIDPTGSCDIRHNLRAPKLDSIKGLTVGLLSNSKANADVLLRETAGPFEISLCRRMERKCCD